MLLLSPYLEGLQFNLRTNYHALLIILIQADATRKLASWRLKLLKYVSEIVHRAGLKHQSANALSEPRTTRVYNTELEEKISVIVVARMKSHDEKQKSIVPNGTQEKKQTINNPEANDAKRPTLVDFIITHSKSIF